MRKLLNSWTLEEYAFGAAALREEIVAQREKGIKNVKDARRFVALCALFSYAFVVTLILIMIHIMRSILMDSKH